MPHRAFTYLCIFIVFGFTTLVCPQTPERRILSGTVVTQQFEAVPGVSIEVKTSATKQQFVSDVDGSFSIPVPDGVFIARFYGKNITETSRIFGRDEATTGLQIKVSYVVPPITENVTIQADSLTPDVEFRNDTLYKNTLFGRDDQIVQTLNAGINAGQHEGGGKSLEIRRYGYNLDHGGVGGGLKVLIDDVQQNQGTQAHGQGYLGSLKSLSPELVDDVTIINGPFSAGYGDFSGLGVVQIRQKESLPQLFTARIQGGSFNTGRGFFAYSPSWKNIDSFVAYEPSYTDGPFLNRLRYRRDNLSGNFTYKFGESKALGFKFNAGRNDFTSSGQLPLDLVANGELDRFGFLDPDNGGKVRLGTLAAYFRKEFATGATLKVDAFVGRSLFDLFTNFTFFRFDPTYGDEIQQHDSRLQQGSTIQYVHPYKVGLATWLLTVGGNFHANQINVGLYPSVGRSPIRKYLPGNPTNANVLLTSAHADVTNYAGYIQNSFNFFGGHLRADLGLRFDVFNFAINGFDLADTRRDLNANESVGKFEPKASVGWSPFEKTPVTFYVNYGRGISSQDARGIARDPSSPKLSTTDFYQAGGSFNAVRFSLALSGFLIDRSNEQVYIADEGGIELKGPSRSYGAEGRATVKLTRFLNFNAGLTQVLKAFYRNEFAADGSRIVVDSAPHFVANAGFILTELRGFNSSLTWRHVSGYRLDGEDRSLLASGNDVVDLAFSKRLRKWVDLNFAIDNLLNKRYFETQNYFESRTCPSCEIASRTHATPGYPLTVSAGLTFRLGTKK